MDNSENFSGLFGKDSWEEAKVDEFNGTIADVTGKLTPWFSEKDPEKKAMIFSISMQDKIRLAEGNLPKSNGRRHQALLRQTRTQTGRQRDRLDDWQRCVLTTVV